MLHRIHRFIVLLGVLCLGVPAEAGAADAYFAPGHEGAVVDLLRPHSDEDMVLGDWTLTTLDAGPACELRLGFTRKGGDGTVTTATLRPATTGEGSFVFRWSPARPDALGAALEALIRGNDPGDFFKERCKAPEVLVEEEQEAEDEEAGDGSIVEEIKPWVPSASAAIWLAVLLLTIGGLVLLVWRGRKKKKAPTPE